MFFLYTTARDIIEIIPFATEREAAEYALGIQDEDDLESIWDSDDDEVAMASKAASDFDYTIYDSAVSVVLGNVSQETDVLGEIVEKLGTAIRDGTAIGLEIDEATEVAAAKKARG